MSVVELARELVQTPSVTGDEHDVTHRVADRLKELPDVEVQLQPVDGFGPNVVARSLGEGPTVVLNGHLDTVPVQGIWTRNPFEAEVDRERIYGLGAVDMKGGDACIIDAFERVHADVDVDLVLALTVDEEGQCAGVFALHELFEREGIDPDLVLIPESTDEAVCLGARGRAAFDVTVRGESGHGAHPGDHVNAIDEAARVVQALDRLQPADHPTLPPATVAPLRIEGGNYSLSIPGECTVTVDRHMVPPETAASVQDELEELIESLDLEVGADVAPIERPTPFLEPYVLTGNEPRVSDLLGFYERHFEQPPEITYARSVGDFNAMAKLAPTVVMGPRGEGLHEGDEWVSTGSLYRVAGFYAALLAELDASA